MSNSGHQSPHRRLPLSRPSPAKRVRLRTGTNGGAHPYRVMPLFFFHLREGAELVEDLEGHELPDFDTARSEAISSAREIVAERILTGKAIDEDEIQLCDESGVVLERVPFVSVLKPA